MALTLNDCVPRHGGKIIVRKKLKKLMKFSEIFMHAK